MSAPRVVADRVKDSTTTEGTGALTLSGTAAVGFQTFNAACGVGPRFAYAISASGSAEWETGEGYLSDATTLVRETCYESSNAGAFVDLSAGTKDVFLTHPAFRVKRAATIGKTLMLKNGTFIP
jgi:hypothetical protein